MTPQDWVTLVLRALLEGELEHHPLVQRLRRKWVWAARVAVLAAAGTLSCAHPTPPTEHVERAGVTVDADESRSVLVVPEKPLPGQQLAPCDEFETEINGGCWIEVPKGKRPDGTCSPKLSAWRGGCYLVAKKSPPIPRSANP